MKQITDWYILYEADYWLVYLVRRKLLAGISCMKEFTGWYTLLKSSCSQVNYVYSALMKLLDTNCYTMFSYITAGGNLGLT
jgi:hypothetical protein